MYFFSLKVFTIYKMKKIKVNSKKTNVKKYAKTWNYFEQELFDIAMTMTSQRDRTQNNSMI